MLALTHICISGLIAALAWTAPAWALSIPPGAETLFTQIEMSEARQMIVRWTGVRGATEHRGFLTARIRDAAERLEMREAALFALDEMDPSADRALAPEIESGAIPGLRKLMRSLRR